MRLTTLAATVALLLTPVLATAKGRGPANTTYRTKLMGVLPVTVKNIGHSYGGGLISIGKGRKYRVGVGRLTVPVTRSMGARLDRWLFKRFVFSKKQVVRQTKMADGREEIQKRHVVINKGPRGTEISDYKKETRTFIDQRGQTIVNRMSPGTAVGTISQRQVMKIRSEGGFGPIFVDALRRHFGTKGE